MTGRDHPLNVAFWHLILSLEGFGGSREEPEPTEEMKSWGLGERTCRKIVGRWELNGARGERRILMRTSWGRGREEDRTRGQGFMQQQGLQLNSRQ